MRPVDEVGRAFLEDTQYRVNLVLRRGRLGGASPDWWFQPARRGRRAETIREIKIINSNSDSELNAKLEKFLKEKMK